MKKFRFAGNRRVAPGRITKDIATNESVLKSRVGLTLIELVVVMAVLGVLAAMLLPKFEGLQNAANHTATGSSISDLNRLIGVYKTSKTVYPDKWDSLMDNSGTALWTAGNAGSQVKGLHTQLVTGTTAKLTTATLTDAEALGLQSAGINTLYNVAATVATATRAGDAFNAPATLSSGMTVAIINTASDNGKKIIDRFYRQNGVTGGVSGTVNGSNTNNKLAVFGVGPLNSLIPNSMMEAPTYGNANATYVYNRLLVVFQLSTSASSGTTSVTYKGSLAADGDLLDDLTVNMQTGNL